MKTIGKIFGTAVKVDRLTWLPVAFRSEPGSRYAGRLGYRVDGGVGAGRLPDAFIRVSRRKIHSKSLLIINSSLV